MKKFLVILAVAVAVAACGDPVSTDDDASPTTPDPTPDVTAEPTSGTAPDSVPPTEPPVETVTEQTAAPSSAPAETSPPESAAPSTSTVPVSPPSSAPPPTIPTPVPTGATAVVYGGSGETGLPWVPLGWWDGSGWRSAGYDLDGSFIVPPSPTIDGVAATSLDLDLGTVGSQVVTGLTRGPDDYYCVDDEQGPIIDFGFEPPLTSVSLGYNAVAVTADWPLQPRPVQQVGLAVPIYATVGQGLFGGVPTAAEGKVVQVVRADLDGNGVEEVLVTFERVTEPNFGAENDFTGIYVRYPSSDGTVVDELLVNYVQEDPIDFPTVGRFTIAAVADLNGDGVMEVAVRDRFWESNGIGVYGLEGGRLDYLFGGGCSI